jgi:hypothetical protein
MVPVFTFGVDDVDETEEGVADKGASDSFSADSALVCLDRRSDTVTFLRSSHASSVFAR